MVTTNMKKFIGSIKRSSTAARSKNVDRRNGELSQPAALPQGDHPEAVVVRETVAFCEAGAPGSSTAGDEFLHLPAIVDAAESCPPAAREAAVTIQRYLSKQNFERGYAQYNAIMLTRILTDNPARVFTQNFDKNFVATVKTLLRDCQDSSVQQICRETLDYFEAEKLNGNDTLMPLIEMWRKEKGLSARMYSSSVGIPEAVVSSQYHAHYYDQGRAHSGAAPRLPPRESRQPRSLPPPDELAARIEEARTSARLLVQMIQSTPQNELINNELVKEFAERARQAHKSIQQYMACENPAPDEHTMLTLIETSEQLNIAMTKHQRAVLQARRATSSGTPPQPPANDHNALPPQQQHQQTSQDYSYRNDFESQDLYRNPSAIVSPVEPNQHAYMPPPGAPPSRRQEPNSTNVAAPPNTVYSQQPYPQDPVTAPRTHERQNSATQDYGVLDNPFADDNAHTAPSGPPPSQQPKSFSLFNRAAGQLRNPGSPDLASDRRNTADLDASMYPTPPAGVDREGQNQRPGAASEYNAGWQPTSSFMHRQESSTANINMSGASLDRR